MLLDLSPQPFLSPYMQDYQFMSQHRFKFSMPKLNLITSLYWINQQKQRE